MTSALYPPFEEFCCLKEIFWADLLSFLLDNSCLLLYLTVFLLLMGHFFLCTKNAENQFML